MGAYRQVQVALLVTCTWPAWNTRGAATEGFADLARSPAWLKLLHLSGDGGAYEAGVSASEFYLTAGTEPNPEASCAPS